MILDDSDDEQPQVAEQQQQRKKGKASDWATWQTHYFGGES